MRFETKKAASDYAKLETIKTQRAHMAIKSSYYSMERMERVNCWTVILTPKNDKKF